MPDRVLICCWHYAGSGRQIAVISLAALEPLAPLAMLSRDSRLIWQLSRREVAARYRGSMLGVVWALVNPLFLLAIYAFVFGGVFRMRWRPGAEGTTDFAAIVFAGMIVHAFFAESVGRAATVVIQNPNFVKKVVFPLETLVWPIVLAALFQFGMSFVVLIAFLLFGGIGLHPTIALVPVVIAPFVLATLGVSWFIAAIGVYIRDIGQAIGLVVTLLLFVSPVFYPLSSVPPQLARLVEMNPLTFIIEQFRAVVIDGAWPDWLGLLVYAIAAAVIAWLGLQWFNRSRKGFADVM